MSAFDRLLYLWLANYYARIGEAKRFDWPRNSALAKARYFVSLAARR